MSVQLHECCITVSNELLYELHDAEDSSFCKLNDAPGMPLVLDFSSATLCERIRTKVRRVTDRIKKENKRRQTPATLNSRSDIIILPEEVTGPKNVLKQQLAAQKHYYQTPLKEKDESIRKKIEENEILRRNLKSLPRSEQLMFNLGGGIDVVQQRQRRRKLNALQNHCKSALWFAESYNLNLMGVEFKVQSSGESIRLHYESPQSSVSESESQALPSSVSESESQLILDQSSVSESESQLIQDQSSVSESESQLILGQSSVSESESQLILGQSSVSESESQLILGQSSVSESESQLILDQLSVSESESQLIQDQSSVSESESQLILDQSSVSESESQSPQSLVVSDSESQSAPQSSVSQLSSFMSSESQLSTLYLLERFGVSDDFYHELTMIHTSLPRSYKIKLARKTLSNKTKLTSLPSPYEGYYRSLAKTIESAIVSEVPDITQLTKVEVKIGGDGAPLSRVTSYTIMSFSLPSLQKNLSSEGVHTIAAVVGPEDYKTMEEGLAPVWAEINQLLEQGFVKVNGIRIPIKIYFCSDYKFLLTVMGMNQANSNYACLYCHVHKDNRWRTDRNFDKRSQDTIATALQSRRNPSYGSKHPPLVNIPLDNIIIDELHLLLRISDILIRNLVWAMERMDNTDKQRGNQLTGSNSHLDLLVKAIRSCGITFRVWISKDGHGKGHEYTSLRGHDRQLLLKRLPSLIHSLLPDDSGRAVQTLWEVYKYLYTLEKRALDGDSLMEKTTKWVESFIHVPNLDGHEAKNVTPYMHLMAIHIPQQVDRVGGIKRFSGQPLEKNNDDCRRYYHSSNRIDGSREIVLANARQEQLGHCSRQKRTYMKRNIEYWTNGILEKRRRSCDVED